MWSVEYENTYFVGPVYLKVSIFMFSVHWSHDTMLPETEYITFLTSAINVIFLQNVNKNDKIAAQTNYNN